MAVNVVSFDDLKKLDLRIGKIIDAQDHPDADRLVVLQIDMGTDVRQICAPFKGIHSLDYLKTARVIVAVNVEARMMRGKISQGVLINVTSEGVSRLLPLDEHAPQVMPGAKVG